MQAVYQFLFNNQNTSEIYDQFAKEHQNKKINLEILNSKLKSIELNSQKINQAIDKTDFDVSKMTKIVAGKKLWNYDALEPTEKKGAI